MILDQVQLPKPIHIGGQQTSLLEAKDFELICDMEKRLIAVTHKRTGRQTIITFEGVAMAKAPEAEKRARKTA